MCSKCGDNPFGLILQSSLEDGTIVISDARITPVEPRRSLSIFAEHLPSPSSIPQVLAGLDSLILSSICQMYAPGVREIPAGRQEITMVR